MPEMYRALVAPLQEDLLPLSTLLHQRGCAHRIVEESGQQVLEVVNPAHVEEVAELYLRWRTGEVRLARADAPARPRRQTPRPGWRAAPAILVLIALSVLGFMLVSLTGASGIVSQLSFLPFELRGGQLQFSDMGDQYWRLVTPVFLHFGWLHIVFNCLWLWELGRRIEAVMGHFNTLMLCLFIAAISNYCQYVYGGAVLFGGMSGVVYGLLGFASVAPLLQPRWAIRPMTSVLLVMVGWLVACMAGLVEALGFGAIANAAHLGGLVSGAVLGALFGLLSRMERDKS